MSQAFLVLGGLGLFLLGMAVMTEGLKNWAGDSLRRALARFTKTPVSGAVTGTISTALMQSSSAVTVMAVGFVGAGLLTFPQTLGIIFGANIGTTVTGWLVALLGIKINLKEIVLPLILLGAMMRLLGRRRIAAAGFALAGFGLIFVGIGLLQEGMEGFSDVVTPRVFPSDGLVGRLALVGIGILITLVTQSSSAGVAAAITAVHVGNISLPQAAAMVIGMDVGTTFTAAMATIGGNVNARRTGIAHVIYNLMTGVAAFLFLPVYMQLWESLAPETARNDPEIALVAFHSLFNTMGVLAALPLTNRFARLIIRLVPSRDEQLTRRLEPSLLQQPPAAVENVLATLTEISTLAAVTLRSLLRSTEAVSSALPELRRAAAAVDATRTYLNKMKPDVADQRLIDHHSVCLHLIDHLARLISRCGKERQLKAALVHPDLASDCRSIASLLGIDLSNPAELRQADEMLAGAWQELDNKLQSFRRETIGQAAAGKITTDDAVVDLDAVRWLRRTCYHAWRIVHHLARASTAGAKLPEEAEFVDEFDEVD